MRNAKSILTFLTITLVVFAFSCTNNRKEKSNSQNETIKLKVGYIPIADCGQLFVGVEKGYFEKENLDIELIKLSGGAKILEALAGGSVDIGFSNVISLILSNSAGLDFKAITGGPVENLNHKETAIMVLKESKIKSPKDLEGKTIAVNTRKNIMELMLVRYFEKHNVDQSKVKLSEIPFPNMEQVLTLNQVDAVATIEPFVTFSTEIGRSRVLSNYFTEVDSVIEISSYNASDKFIANNKNAIIAFQSAMKAATDYALTHEEEMKMIVSKYTNLSSEQLENMVLPSYTHELNVDRLQLLADKVFQLSWSENKVKAESIIE